MLENREDGMRGTARRIFSLISLGVAYVHLSVSDAVAQTYPDKPVRVLVGYTAGGATDFTARAVAQRLSELLGQQVIVVNVPGASGSIATARLAASPPDGYTLSFVTGADTIQVALRAKLPYDLERDTAPVSLIVTGAYALVVHPSVPAGNVRELIALARSHPRKLSYGSAGIGNSSHLAGELFNLLAKVSTVHVPYKGAVESVVATASGEVDMSYPSVSASLPLLNAGKLRALAVTSTKRASLLPSVPTFDEAGLPGYESSTWYGVSAPEGVSKDIVTRLNGAIARVVNTPAMKDAFGKQGLEPRTSSPDEFSALIHSEIAKNARLIRQAGVKAE
jgi:tripartite-type tricarboxylate transporter receptor subunit TctC